MISQILGEGLYKISVANLHVRINSRVHFLGDIESAVPQRAASPRKIFGAFISQGMIRIPKGPHPERRPLPGRRLCHIVRDKAVKGVKPTVTEFVMMAYMPTQVALVMTPSQAIATAIGSAIVERQEK